MRQIFEQKKIDANKTILSVNDSELNSEGFSEKIYDQFKIKTPHLDKENTDVQINEEMIGFGNAPNGISFRPGQKMEYALFSVPVIGDTELFGIITKHLFTNSKNSGFDGRNVLYKEFSQTKITGNDNIIKQIKNNAKDKFDAIESTLEEFKKDADEFNENDLKPFIIDNVEKERKKRNTRNDSENKLNPFD
jgi:hypothetical protein